MIVPMIILTVLVLRDIACTVVGKKIYGELKGEDLLRNYSLKLSLLGTVILILKAVSEISSVVLAINSIYTLLKTLLRWMTDAEPYPMINWTFSVQVLGGIIVADLLKTFFCYLYQKHKGQQRVLTPPRKMTFEKEYFEAIPGCEIVSHQEKAAPSRSPIKELLGQYLSLTAFCGFGAWIAEGTALTDTLGLTVSLLIGAIIIFGPVIGIIVCSPTGGHPEMYELRFSDELSAKDLLQIQEKFQLEKKDNDIWIATPKREGKHDPNQH